MEDGMKFDEVELNFILEAIDAYKELAKIRAAEAPPTINGKALPNWLISRRTADPSMADHYLIAMKKIEDRISDYLD
jgi:hypothetical protein